MAKLPCGNTPASHLSDSFIPFLVSFVPLKAFNCILCREKGKLVIPQFEAYFLFVPHIEQTADLIIDTHSSCKVN